MFVPRESDGDGIGVPSRMALKEAAERWKRLFYCLSARVYPKWGHPLQASSFMAGLAGSFGRPEPFDRYANPQVLPPRLAS